MGSKFYEKDLSLEISLSAMRRLMVSIQISSIFGSNFYLGAATDPLSRPAKEGDKKDNIEEPGRFNFFLTILCENCYFTLFSDSCRQHGSPYGISIPTIYL
jgi:hypothetical protein